jgi:hypothetical protein
MTLLASARSQAPSPTDDGPVRDPHQPAPVRSVDTSAARPRLAMRETGEPTTLKRLDIVYEWGIESFPASDPPSNW